MGSTQLIDALSTVASSQDHRQILGDLAGAIARRLDVAEPDFLPRGRTDSWVSRIDADRLTPHVLGQALEALTASTQRRARGAHFTSNSLATRVVATALDTWFEQATKCPRVLDPAAGGGAFLLAVADGLLARGFDRDDIVRHLHAVDIDQTSLDVCATALSLWSGTSDDALHCSVGDALDQLGETPIADVVVGNPPFLAQLKSSTSRAASSTGRLNRYGLENVGYLDEAGAFLVAATYWVAENGVVSLIVPQSLLGTADGQKARERFEDRATLRHFYVPSDDAFEAAVHVVVITGRRERPAKSSQVRVESSARSTTIPHPISSRWADALAALQGVPSIDLAADSDQVLGSVAGATAGFRQHFYGLAPAVRETAQPTPDQPKLVTVGAIDPLRCEWGRRAVRFAGTRWQRPVVDIEEIPDESVRDWFTARQIPKLLLASQTRVVETIVDATGTLLPSVPVISIEIRADAPAELSLWHLAALLTSAEVSAWLRNGSAGTGLSSDTIRIRAATLMTLPLPAAGPAWDAAADAAKEAQHAADTSRREADHQEHLEHCVSMMHEVWRTPEATRDELRQWWKQEAAGRQRPSTVS